MVKVSSIEPVITSLLVDEPNDRGMDTKDLVIGKKI